MKPIRTVITLAIVLSGCTTKPIPHAAQARVDLPPGLMRFPEQIGTYHLGRTASASQMDEAHPVYRLEESAGWNLSGMGEAKPGQSPPILLDEAKAELYRQRELSRVMTEQASQLSDSVKRLDTAFAGVTNLAHEQKRLSDRLLELESRFPKITNAFSR